MALRREIQVSEAVAHLAGDFFARESNQKSLITVTRADLSRDFKNATVYFSVLPQTMEEVTLKTAKRQRTDFRTYVREHSLLHPIPFFDFAIDLGEKNRQRIDELTRK
jgi:ribosome-binding factor A